MLDIMKLIRPPRAAFLDFPLGHPTGKPFQPDLQLAILRDSLGLLETAREPGLLVELPYPWGEPFTYAGPEDQPGGPGLCRPVSRRDCQ